MNTNSSIGKRYKTTREKVDGRKFTTGMLSLFNPVLWLKDIFSLFNLRKLIIYALILGTVFGYAYYQGLRNKPIKLDIGYGKEATINLNGEELYIDKDGNVFLRDSKTKKVIKQISVKDIEGLRSKLSPFGFELTPIMLAGLSAGGNDAGAEVGIGFSFIRFYQARLEAFITSYPAVYLGCSYKLERIAPILKNSGIGVGLGSDAEDLRGIVYWRTEW